MSILSKAVPTNIKENLYKKKCFDIYIENRVNDGILAVFLKPVKMYK